MKEKYVYKQSHSYSKYSFSSVKISSACLEKLDRLESKPQKSEF